MAAAASCAALLAAAPPASADVPVPSCKGHDPAAAATAKAEGLKHYRLSKRTGRDDAEMAAALGFFEASCAAGDDSALELRAYALAGVERFVEAAQTLDVFLNTHPLEVLPDGTRARVLGQQPEILARVASLNIDTNAQGAKVTINHQLAGVTPLAKLRLAPGRYDIEVTPEGEPPMTRSVDLAAGDHTETFNREAKPEPASAAPPVHDEGGGIGTPVIAAAAGTGVLLLAGLSGVIWANERASVYNDAQCDGTSKSGCPGALSQYNAARDLEIVGFVGAGLGAVGTGVLYYLTRSQASHPASPPPAAKPPSPAGPVDHDQPPPGKAEDAAKLSVTCSFLGAGASCSGTF